MEETTNLSEEMPSQSVDKDMTQFLHKPDFSGEESVEDLKLEPLSYQPLRIQFTRKSKKVLTDKGNRLNARRRRRNRGKSNVSNSREENKENLPGPPKKSDESFLQDWHDDEVEIADYRSSDDSQDEQLVDWYKDLESNKTKNINLSSSNDNLQNVGPVIRHESSSEEKSWLHSDIAENYLLNMLAKYPAADNPRKIVFEDLTEPHSWIERTHLIAADIMRMKESRIFTILRQNRPRNLLAHLRLGYCVTHIPGQPKCQQEGQTCSLQCHLCGVCCHMYSCTCRLVKRFQWCSHIHAAVSCGANKFKNDQQVYLHISSRYTQLSHLRATCFDMANDVKPVENNKHCVSVMSRATNGIPISVTISSNLKVCHECPQYKRCPECSICCHQYLCTCAEYKVEKRLCEHCHVVAIFQSSNRDNMLKTRAFHFLSDVSDDTDEEADSDQEPSPIMLPLRKLAAHHERSYSIPLKRIQVRSANDQVVYFVPRCNPDQQFVVFAKKKDLCNCSKESTSPEDLACINCKICHHCFTCNCGKKDAELCKHVHAVQRYIVRSGNWAPANQILKSALGSIVRQALSDHFEGSVTDENIMAIIENLKSDLRNDVKQNADEPSVSHDNAIGSKVSNLEAVVQEANQVSNSEDKSNEKNLGEIDTCTTCNGDSIKSDSQNSIPVSEKSDNCIDATDESGEKSAAGIIKPSFLDCNPETDVCNSDSVLGKNSSESFNVNSLAEIIKSDSPNSDSTKQNSCSLRTDLDVSCNNDAAKASECSLQVNPDNESKLPALPKMDSIDANNFERSLVVDDKSQAEIQQCNLVNNDSTSMNSVESVPGSDSTNVKSFESCHKYNFKRPIVKILYKDAAGLIKDEYTFILAENKKCIVTAEEGNKKNSSRVEPVQKPHSDSGSETLVKDDEVPVKISELDVVRKNLGVLGVSARKYCPDLNTVLPTDSSCAFGVAEDDRNRLSKTHEPSLVAKDFELSCEGRELNCKPAPVENCHPDLKIKDEPFAAKDGAPCVDQVKDLRRKCSSEKASTDNSVLLDFENAGDGFMVEKEDKNLIPSEKFKSSNFAKTVKDKSLNFMRKLNLAKYYKKSQEEERSRVRFFGGKPWSRSQRQRELAALQSVSGNFRSTDTIYDDSDSDS